MIPRTREAAGSITDDGKTTRVSSSSSAATPWLKSKDPRIVRVSRAFGGKDRHSKVCTVRGLRDRRVRLSVPTAIQLYDLQDRLGFNQPSKVVDWLLNEAKHEIDELPPLPGNFIQNYHSFLPSNQGNNWDDQTGLNFWNSSTLSRSKSKENLTKINEEENNNSSLHGMLNSVMPYGSYYHLEPSNLTFSQLGSHGITTQQEDQHLQSFNVLPLQPTLSLPSAASSTTEFDHPRHINHFHMLSSTFSISQSMRPFQLSKTLDGHIDSTNDDSPTQLHRDS